MVLPSSQAILANGCNSRSHSCATPSCYLLRGGGLFKEFLTNVVRSGFNTDFGLFRSTAESSIYPNPASEMSGPGELHLHYIAFLGRMVGKALPAWAW